MAKLTIVRTSQPLPNMDSVGQFLFGSLDGFTRADKRGWRRMWKRIRDMEPGELLAVDMRIQRNSKFHRKFFAMLQIGFDAWEPPRQRRTYKGHPVQKNFERFREDVTIAAGFYEQTFDLKGRLKLQAKSISFAHMDDAEFENVYSAVADVLLGGVLVRYTGRAELDDVVNRILDFV